MSNARFTAEQITQLRDADADALTEAEEQLERSADIASPDDIVAYVLKRHADPMGNANHLLELDIQETLLTAFIEERGDVRRYAFVGPDGEGWMTNKQFGEWRYARDALREATGWPAPKELKPKEWKKVQRALLRAKTVSEPSDEETLAGRATMWMRSFVESAPAIAEEEPGNVPDATPRELLVWRGRNGHAYVYGVALRRHILTMWDEHVKSGEFGEAMRKAGAVCDPLHVTRADGRRTTRSWWRLPAKVLGEVDSPSDL